MASKKDNLRKAQAETMKEYGRTAGAAGTSLSAARKYFATQVSEGLVTLPAADSKDYSKAVMTEAKWFHSQFYAGMREADNTLPNLADSSLETYANQYVLIASPKVFANLSKIEAAVNAFTVGKSKKEMHGKDNSAILKQIASAVRKGKIDPAKITPELIDKTITPADKKKGEVTPAKVLSPDVLARNAFTSGIKAMLDDGGLDDAQKKSLLNIAKKLNIKI